MSWLLPYLFGTAPQSFLRGCLPGFKSSLSSPNKTWHLDRGGIFFSKQVPPQTYYVRRCGWVPKSGFQKTFQVGPIHTQVRAAQKNTIQPPQYSKAGRNTVKLNIRSLNLNIKIFPQLHISFLFLLFFIQSNPIDTNPHSQCKFQQCWNFALLSHTVLFHRHSLIRSFIPGGRHSIIQQILFRYHRGAGTTVDIEHSLLHNKVACLNTAIPALD